MLKANIINNLLIVVILITLVIPLGSAPPPVSEVQQFTEGFFLKVPADSVLKQSESYEFEVHAYNISNGLPIISGISCYLHLYNSTGNHIYEGFDATASHNFDYTFNVNGGNFSSSGVYYINYQCNNSILGGYEANYLEITPNGEEATEGKAIFYMGLFAVLIFFFAISLYFMINGEHLLIRGGGLGFAYLTLLIITFIGWNMANDFLTSSPIIISFLRTLFFVLIIGALPMLLGALAWYFLMTMKVKAISNLMTKGLSYDEAERRTGRKYK